MTSKSKEVAIEVVIYGLREDAYNVGNLLSEDDLYLQHPNECDARMTYINPQYLVRPGCEMSELHGVSFALASKSSSGNDILDEKRTIQLLQVFNYANGPTKFSKVLESPRLRTHLQDHQMKALAMMAEKEQGVLEGSQFGTLWDVSIDANGQNCYRHVITGSSQSTPPNPIYGGLLADEMGLGKTLSVLALITWSLDTLSINASSAEAALPRGTLIVAPKSTIPGWQQQIQRHIVSGGVRVALYYGSNRSRLSEELNTYDIILTNYDTLRSEWIGKGRDAPLCSQEWARLVLDEAHHIRNRSSKTFEAACAIPARHRWCLTGTPIHNRLDDYGALMTFLGVPPFSSKSLFDYWLTIPMNKNHSDGLRRLKKLVMATCLRRTKETVKEKLKLPQRIEREERINLNNHERELYDFFKARTFALVTGMLCELHGSSEQQKQGNILGLINCLRRICNHSEQLLPTAALNAWRSRNTSGVDWSFAQSSTSTCNFCNAELDNSERLDSPWSELSCLHVICSNCTITRIEDSELPANDPCPVCNTESTMLLCQKHPIHSSEEIALRYQPSTKVNALLENLYRERKLNSSNITGNPIKSVIFSQWTKMLDLIEIALRANGFIFQRIDGQKSLDQRIRALDVFNNNLACTVMLASIGSVAEGVDLQVANHVHLVEPHWNPMVEAQAVDRIHRMGQSRDVVTIRYIANNTIEKYVQDVQAYKLSLIHQSLGELESVQYEADEAKWKSLMAALE
ncbi:hypothetical protein K432DRAFT_318094 [Lepidopterella palustris CBS 459.81]|uniref:Uncharacterized protein n=1 Tax=Lepidopterella palustris CBS 459.81 TaxID=1314670 RepID=A0A8E2JKB5_9PEZI|nr:hypothetical protein K432DRAFT_318094 [Lepidopterella palustris CBS 459.81]